MQLISQTLLSLNAFFQVGSRAVVFGDVYSGMGWSILRMFLIVPSGSTIRNSASKSVLLSTAAVSVFHFKLR